MKISDITGPEPLATHPFLPRAEVVALLSASAAPLGLLVAPPGCGKTMALLAFARAMRAGGHACHWSTPEDLGTAPTGGILLIDPARWPADPQTEADLMAQIRARLPRQRILIALGQRLPQLLRDEWIAGRAALFSAQDLAFRAEETAALFGETRISREVHLLHQFTLGWPLGLGLLSRDRPQAFALMQRDGLRQPLPPELSLWFDDWLSRSLDAAGQRLLMDLAVFGRFPATLVQELPAQDGEPQPGDMALMAPILDQGLFVTASEKQPGWFSLMPAFARYLRDRQSLFHPDRAAQIRRFALSWSAGMQDSSGQLRHGLAVWSRDEAMEQVNATGAIAASLAEGPDLELQQPISAASALTTPLAFFGVIYERIRLGAFEEARLHYSNAMALTSGFTRFETPQDPAQLQGWIDVFSAVMQISDDAPVKPARRAAMLADLRHSVSRDPVLALAQSTVAMLMALNAGARDEALAICRPVLQMQDRSRADKAAIFVHLHRASALIASARLEEARAAIAAGQKIAADHTYADSYELISCQIHSGLCAFEAGDFASARDLLEPCFAHLPQIHGWRRNWLDYFSALAAIAAQAKTGGGAGLWLGRGMELAVQRNQPQLALGLSLSRIELALRAGQSEGLAEAFARLSEEMQAAEPVAPQIRQLADLTWIGILLSQGDVAKARVAFAKLDRAAMVANDLRLELQALSLGLEFARLDGDVAAMRSGLDQAVPLARALPRLAKLPQILNRLLLAHDSLIALSADPGKEARAFCATLSRRGRPLLSPRETQIIGLIAEGLSTKEIARALGSSEGTVKSHRKNLYEKLSASTRSKAIARAKDLGLLGGD